MAARERKNMAVSDEVKIALLTQGLEAAIRKIEALESSVGKLEAENNNKLKAGLKTVGAAAIVLGSAVTGLVIYIFEGKVGH